MEIHSTLYWKSTETEYLLWCYVSIQYLHLTLPSSQEKLTHHVGYGLPCRGSIFSSRCLSNGTNSD
jgi:hypothetical protein